MSELYSNYSPEGSGNDTGGNPRSLIVSCLESDPRADRQRSIRRLNGLEYKKMFTTLKKVVLKLARTFISTSTFHNSEKISTKDVTFCYIFIRII